MLRHSDASRHRRVERFVLPVSARLLGAVSCPGVALFQRKWLNI